MKSKSNIDEDLKKMVYPNCKNISLPIEYITYPIYNQFNPLKFKILKRNLKVDITTKILPRIY